MEGGGVFGKIEGFLRITESFEMSGAAARTGSLIKVVMKKYIKIRRNVGQ